MRFASAYASALSKRAEKRVEAGRGANRLNGGLCSFNLQIAPDH
jgi:hypothetical protein